MILLLVIAGFVVVYGQGALVSVLVWRSTRRVRNPYLRGFFRSLVIAAAFTPTLVPVSWHGAAPCPALLVVIAKLATLHDRDSPSILVHCGIIPIAVVFAALWSLMTISSLVVRFGANDGTKA
jgi:hypothetical protein